MSNEPILVVSGGVYYSMIHVTATNAILVSATSAISTAAIGTVTVVDPNIFSKAKYANANPPNTP